MIRRVAVTASLLAGALLLAPQVPPASSAPSRSPTRAHGGVVRVDHHDPTALPARGPSNAVVTIELFLSPGPSSRHQMVRMLERLQDHHPSRIRIVYRVVRGSSARVPVLALEAHASGKFFEFLDELHKLGTNVRDHALVELGARIGLDPERVSLVMSRPPAAYTRIIEANDRRKKQRIRGNPSLPTMLFNGRPLQTPLSSTTMADLEREYRAAKDAADELIDRGADPSTLAQAFDQIAAPPPDLVVHSGPTDEDLERVSSADAPLARPPLRLQGLPAFGPTDAETTIVVLCAPTSPNCQSPLKIAKVAQDVYPEAVRVVWAPYFDVAREDAAELSLLADAALCAEKIGTSADDLGTAASPGWRWVEAVLAEASNRHRRVAIDQVLDRVADRLRVEPRAFATCRAQLAGASIAWIEAARRAGVRSSPSTIVGGRIYGPITDSTTMQLLVEQELAPGFLGTAAPPWSTRGRHN
jgi:hypothetical protein